jgi:hypothetical protein
MEKQIVVKVAADERTNLTRERRACTDGSATLVVNDFKNKTKRLGSEATLERRNKTNNNENQKQSTIEDIPRDLPVEPIHHTRGR